jgi:transposase-like protein
MTKSKPYPQDLRDRAVRLVLETEEQYPSRDAAIKSIAAKLGIGTAHSLRNWVRLAEQGPAVGVGAGVAGADGVVELDRLVPLRGLGVPQVPPSGIARVRARY